MFPNTNHDGNGRVPVLTKWRLKRRAGWKDSCQGTRTTPTGLPLKPAAFSPWRKTAFARATPNTNWVILIPVTRSYSKA